jgi:hypothetical protein
VSNPLFKPPANMVKEWPEVFEDLYMNTMPVNYIKSLRLEFKDGRVWEIDVEDKLTTISTEALSSKMLDVLREYREDIHKIDFSINTEKLKTDVISSTQKIFIVS